MNRPRLNPAFSLLALYLLASPATAQQIESAYTDLNLDQCTVMQSDDFGSTWACAGLKGYPLLVAEGDLRFFLSYGFGAEEEKVREQTLPPFNNIGTKLEWRVSNATGGFRPFATIVRYLTDRPESDEDGQILVVTRLAAGGSCHVAYVDAQANADANLLAQQAADAIKPEHDCETPPVVVGKWGEDWQP
jgi:hypothetical protein